MNGHGYRSTTYRKRLLAWLIDTAFLAVCGALMTTIALWLKQSWPVVISLALFGLIKVYFWTMSTTMGKFCMGLKVVHRGNNMDLTLMEMTLRQTLGRFVSVMFLYVGIIWILIDDEHQGWHDKIADSVVVEVIEH